MKEVLEYTAVTSEGVGEIIEKKSRFIGYVLPVETVEEAETRIAEISKKHWDARHNCYAYIIGKRGEQVKCSDNGEPSGTAGKPILEVLKGAGLTNTLIVVTRYFGGVLLGTGGLVRAYTQSAQAGLAEAQISRFIYGQQLTVQVDYSLIDPLQYFFKQKEITPSDIRYTDKVEFDICIPLPQVDSMIEEITKQTNGRAVITKGDTTYSAVF